MKRLAPLLLAVVGCQQYTIGPPAKILGINDMVRVGQYLVVPSTERDELRVLNMVTDTVDVRKYVPAPDPLSPLAIPVLSRPTYLAVDTRYIDYNGVPGGAELTGPFVYASSPGSPDISVVNIGEGQPSPDGGSTAPNNVEQFVEIRRLLTSAPITAMAASTMDGRHELYFAMFDGTTAGVWFADMKTPELTLMSASAQQNLFNLPDGEVVMRLVALPGHKLAVATRVNSGSGGRAFIYAIDTAATTTLQFPGPVRRIMTHAGAALGYGPGTIPPGFRIFGILDEEACGSSACGGIIAADADTGLISIDQPGTNVQAADASVPRDQVQMLPLRFGNSLVTGLTLQPQGAMVVPASQTGSVATEEALSVLGVATLSSGGIVFINAGSLIVYDADDNSTPVEIPPAIVGETITDAFGNIVATDNGPIIDGGPTAVGGPGTTVVLTDGKARDENIHVVFTGIIPNLVSLPATSSGVLTVGGGAEVNAKPADIVVGCLNVDGGIFNDDGGLITSGTVTSVVDGGILFAVTGTCPGPYSIRAGPVAPFVVQGDTTGFMGRAVPGQTFFFDGGYTRHPNGIFDPNAPQLALPFAADTSGLSVDEQWLLAVDDNYNPILSSLDPTAANCGLPVNLLGAVSVNPDLQHIFFAVPSANGIVDMAASAATRLTVYSGLVCYR